MGRLGDWLFGTVDTAAPAPAVSAAAGRVALARGMSRAATPAWGFGPPLAPFTVADELATWWDREAAMSLPTISRARDLICSTVSVLPFTAWSVSAATVPPVERRLPGPGWFDRPDPDRTRQWLLAWTVDDLMFYERAHWLVTARYDTTFPRSFRRIPPGDLHVADDGTVKVTTSSGQRPVDPRDVVEFLSPIQGLLSNGFRAISIALQLDGAADRFASCEVPAGVLEEQDGSEDMSADELAAEAAAFSEARITNTIAATNKYLRYREIPFNAQSMQLVEGREYQALELARLGNIPPYLVGAPAGTGMTYQNGQQARQDLIDFGAAPYIACLEQTLSGPNVTPHGVHVRLDLNVWLRNPFTTTTDATAERSPNDLEVADDPTPTPTAVPA